MRPQGRSSLTGRTAPVQIALSVFLSSMLPCHGNQVEEEEGEVVGLAEEVVEVPLASLEVSFIQANSGN